MIPVPSGVRVWLAVGHTDMRRGMNSLALQVQQALGRDPYAGDLYVFRGRRGDLVKIVWHDGAGMSNHCSQNLCKGICQVSRQPTNLSKDSCVYAVASARFNYPMAGSDRPPLGGPR